MSVEFTDEAGNVSVVAEDTITLDRQAPTDNSVTINEGEFVSSAAITLTPASTGAAWMRFSRGRHLHGRGMDGLQPDCAGLHALGRRRIEDRVRAVSRRGGQRGYRRSADTVTLDTQAPMATSLIINGLDEFVDRYRRYADLQCFRHATSVASMRFSEDGLTLSDWEKLRGLESLTRSAAAKGSMPFTLSTATRRAMCGAAFDTITLDSVAPTGMISINSGSVDDQPARGHVADRRGEGCDRHALHGDERPLDGRLERAFADGLRSP